VVDKMNATGLLINSVLERRFNGSRIFTGFWAGLPLFALFMLLKDFSRDSLSGQASTSVDLYNGFQVSGLTWSIIVMVLLFCFSAFIVLSHYTPVWRINKSSGWSFIRGAGKMCCELSRWQTVTKSVNGSIIDRSATGAKFGLILLFLAFSLEFNLFPIKAYYRFIENYLFSE
jgi:hypothetical protein